MINADIEKLALANGFKLKEQPSGEMALNPYVFDFARALADEAVVQAICACKVTPEFGSDIMGTVRVADLLKYASSQADINQGE